MAAKFNIPLIFFGENPGEGGKKISHNTKGVSLNSTIPNHQGLMMISTMSKLTSLKLI